MQIPELAVQDIVLLDILCALSVHAFYRRFEPDTSRPFTQTLLLVVVPSFPAVMSLQYLNKPAILVLPSTFVLFYTALTTSIILYRLSPWHPLARYPGPLFAKVSKFWAAYRVTKGKLHLDFKAVHDKYGEYVRVGPNEISIADASVIPSALGDGMPKGPMWEARTPTGVPALIAIRSTKEHTRRRARWNRAFSSASVKGYEPILQKRALQFVSELEKRTLNKGVPSVNLSQWIGFFTTDFMGDMAFGGGFELMRDGGDKEGFWTTLESGMKSAAIIQQIPWIAPLLHKLPFVSKNLRRLRQFGVERVKARKANGSLTKDLFYHLIDEDNVDQIVPTDTEVISDGTLAIIAGSDTTSTTLSGLFYHLLSNPLDYQRLQKEIDQAFPHGEGDPFDTLKLSQLPFLNSVINEAMRIQPAVPTYLQRAPESGTGGKWIGDRFITEGISVVVPLYVLFRQPIHFSPAPEVFWPDRWMKDTVKRPPYRSDSDSGKFNSKYEGEAKTNSTAFIPFSFGAANCAGRALALTEIRTIVALLVQRFEMKLDPRYTTTEWEEHLEDLFAFSCGRLPVVLTSRA